MKERIGKGTVGHQRLLALPPLARLRAGKTDQLVRKTIALLLFTSSEDSIIQNLKPI